MELMRRIGNFKPKKIDAQNLKWGENNPKTMTESVEFVWKELWREGQREIEIEIEREKKKERMKRDRDRILKRGEREKRVVDSTEYRRINENWQIIRLKIITNRRLIKLSSDLFCFSKRKKNEEISNQIKKVLFFT